MTKPVIAPRTYKCRNKYCPIRIFAFHYPGVILHKPDLEWCEECEAIKLFERDFPAKPKPKCTCERLTHNRRITWWRKLSCPVHHDEVIRAQQKLAEHFLNKPEKAHKKAGKSKLVFKRRKK